MLIAVIISLIIVAIFNLGIGLIVLLGSKGERSHRMFFLLTCSVFLWTFGLAVFLLSRDSDVANAWASLYYIAAAFIAYLSLAFALNYPDDDAGKNTLLLMLLVPALAAVGAIVISGGLIESITIAPLGQVNSVHLHDVLYAFYSAYFVLYLYGAFMVIASKMRRAIRRKNTRLSKQLKYMLVGMALAGTFGTFFNLILPLFGEYGLIWVGPMFTFIYIGSIFYAIIRHKLFDVRLAFARVVAYALLVATMAIVYGLGVFSTSAFLFQGSQIDVWREVVYVLLALFLAFTFQPLKVFFDRVTDRLFFRDDYNLESTLDRLGNATVNEIDLQRLVHKAQQSLFDALKPTFLNAVIYRHEDSKTFVEEFAMGSSSREVSDAHEDMIEVIEQTAIKEDVIFQSNITNPELYQSLVRYGVACIVILRTKHELDGYLFVGQKQNGTVYRRKDVQLLNTAADELAIAVQNALRFEEIEHFNKRLQGEIRDATAELRQSNRKLHELDDAKDDFISMASHQLRTPLTSIKGYLSMVLEGDMGKISTSQRKVLEEAYTSSQRMVYLISDFLNVSRLQTGKFELERSPTNLASMLTGEIAQLQAMAQGRHLTIDYTPPANFPIVNIDEDKFRQVMMNFIDNAIYYSRPNAPITVTLAKDANDLVFKVVDQGIGVPANERHKLFTKFYRASNAKKQRPDGTGIGLFMAQKVIIAHGGSVVFESKENVGSTFGFRLPLETSTKK